jgi:alpha-galactosidase
VYGHGVVAADANEAVVAYVQLDEQVAAPEPLLIPGLAAERDYVARQLLPAVGSAPWAGEGMTFSGAVLGDVGLPAPARAPETVTIIHLVRVGPADGE